MLDWLGDEGFELRKAFRSVFGAGCRPFGNKALRIGGVSDGNDGVQWNAAFDPRDGRRWIGVNLEGLKYSGWPVARLIKRELQDPTLLTVRSNSGNPGPTEVLWVRDYWQVASRPAIQEGKISPTPIRLSQLTSQLWQDALDEALGCLELTRSGWGRAKHEVTLAASGEKVLGPVSPHLTLVFPAEGSVGWREFFLEAKSRMQPYYDWVAERSA